MPLAVLWHLKGKGRRGALHPVMIGGQTATVADTISPRLPHHSPAAGD